MFIFLPTSNFIVFGDQIGFASYFPQCFNEIDDDLAILEQIHFDAGIS